MRAAAAASEPAWPDVQARSDPGPYLVDCAPYGCVSLQRPSHRISLPRAVAACSAASRLPRPAARRHLREPWYQPAPRRPSFEQDVGLTHGTELCTHGRRAGHGRRRQIECYACAPVSAACLPPRAWVALLHIRGYPTWHAYHGPHRSGWLWAIARLRACACEPRCCTRQELATLAIGKLQRCSAAGRKQEGPTTPARQSAPLNLRLGQLPPLCASNAFHAECSARLIVGMLRDGVSDACSGCNASRAIKLHTPAGRRVSAAPSDLSAPG